MSDKTVRALEELTLQVARLAYAVECGNDCKASQPCKACRCLLVPDGSTKCPACGTEINHG